MRASGVVLASALLLSLGACGEKKSGGEATKASTTPAKAETVKTEPKAEPVKAEEPKAAEPAKPAADMSKLTLADKKGWEGEYNAALTSWTFEKYTPAKDGTNEPNRFYLDVLPDDAPKTVEEYATKLQEKDWQDFGYKYSEIKAKTALPNGFLITGLVQDMSDATAKPEAGFVLVFDVGGTKLRCKSGTMTSEKLRDEALAVCKTAKF